jgi:hypothetical protein
MHPIRFALWTALGVFAGPALAAAQAAPTDAPSSSVAPTVAGASPGVGDDVLRLRDGTVLTGTIAERRPDGTTVILLLTGEVRTVPGDAILPDAPSFVAPLAEVPLTDADTSLATLEPAPGRVPLRVRSIEGPIAVGMPLGSEERELSIAGSVTVRHYGQLCTTPCTLYVRPGTFPLWSDGPGLMKIEQEIYVPRGGLDLRLHASSIVAHGFGIALTILGGLGASVSVPLLVAETNNPYHLYFHEDTGVAIAATVVAVSALMHIGGVLLWSLTPGNIASQWPLRSSAASAPRWRVGAAPLPGGAAVTALLTF